MTLLALWSIVWMGRFALPVVVATSIAMQLCTYVHIRQRNYLLGKMLGIRLLNLDCFQINDLINKIPSTFFIFLVSIKRHLFAHGVSSEEFEHIRAQKFLP